MIKCLIFRKTDKRAVFNVGKTDNDNYGLVITRFFMYMKIVSKLVKRKETSNKALMVAGARQVGKTYIIREFLKNEVDENDFVEFNENRGTIDS